jgi:hypothetical protein
LPNGEPIVAFRELYDQKGSVWTPDESSLPDLEMALEIVDGA